MHILAVTPGTGFDAAAWGAVLRSGVDGFLVREPDLEAGDLLGAARWCREAAPGVELWVRGRLDVALACGAGLHAPEAYPEPPPGRLPLSRPLHAPSQFAARRGCAQLLLAPVLPTPGKGAAWGAAELHGFLDGLEGPAPRLLALGGVAPDNAAALRHPRLDGVALIRAIWTASEPARVVEALRAAWA
jgi:thiamine-phosphate pyrophosphorylase